MTNDDSKRIIDFDNLRAIVGKTVDSLYMRDDAIAPTAIGVRFTDGQFVFIGIDHGYDGEEWLGLDGTLYENDLVGMGIVSAEEVQARRDAEKRKRADADAVRERQLYEQLRAKFS